MGNFRFVRYAVGGHLYFAKTALIGVVRPLPDYTAIIGRTPPNKPQGQARLVHGLPRPNHGKPRIYGNKKRPENRGALLTHYLLQIQNELFIEFLNMLRTITRFGGVCFLRVAVHVQS